MAHRNATTKTDRSTRRRPTTHRLTCETLEDRRLLAAVAGPGVSPADAAQPFCVVLSSAIHESAGVALPDTTLPDELAKVADLNSDGDLTVDDLDALVAAIAGNSNDPRFDVNGDGEVGQPDLDAWLTFAAESLLGPGRSLQRGDADLNGVVDEADFNQWMKHRFTHEAAWSAGDFNADGVVDGLDFVLWNRHGIPPFSGQAGSRPVNEVVIEPAQTTSAPDNHETPPCRRSIGVLDQTDGIPKEDPRQSLVDAVFQSRG